MIPIRLGLCASMMQLSYILAAIIVPLWILNSWDFTRGSSIVYIYGIAAIILLLILASCVLIKSMLAFLDETDVLSKSFYRPRIVGNYGYTNVDVYFSSFSNSGVLSEHKNTSNDPIIKNISVDLLDYLYKEDIYDLSLEERKEAICSKKATDIICRILYAEMQADKAAEYASKVISSPDSVLFEEYQDLIAEYKAMRKEAIEELKNYIGEKIKASQGQKEIQKALSNTPNRNNLSEAQSWDAKFEKV